MPDVSAEHGGDGLDSRKAALSHLRSALREGRPWAHALLEGIALWTLPQETYRGRSHSYFISGEAFDWLLLAERLLLSVRGLVPDAERDALLFEGRLPADLCHDRFRELIGAEKYRGYLNYLYGVTVEEALQVAVEEEVWKRRLSNGLYYEHDPAEDAFQKIYHSSRSALYDKFREDAGYPARSTVGLPEVKEFTYWLFKYRLKNSDSAKVASDTRKGLEQLQRVGAVYPALFEDGAEDVRTAAGLKASSAGGRRGPAAR